MDDDDWPAGVQAGNDHQLVEESDEGDVSISYHETSRLLAGPEQAHNRHCLEEEEEDEDSVSIGGHETSRPLTETEQAHNRHRLEEGDLDKDSLLVSATDALHVVQEHEFEQTPFTIHEDGMFTIYEDEPLTP